MNKNITAKDDRLFYISKRLKETFHDNIINIVLFGSRARGDFNEGSDYDLLIVLKDKDNEITDKIREIEVEFLDKYSILSAALIYSEDEWIKRINSPIGINIKREGINL